MIFDRKGKYNVVPVDHTKYAYIEDPDHAQIVPIESMIT